MRVTLIQRNHFFTFSGLLIDGKSMYLIAGMAAWKQSSMRSSIVYEHTILPFLAKSLNPPRLPVSLSSILSKYFVSIMIVQGISSGLIPSNFLTYSTTIFLYSATASSWMLSIISTSDSLHLMKIYPSINLIRPYKD